MIFEKKNNLQTAQEWTKSYIELIASYVHPKTGNHLRSHLRAIMALDHRRLIRPGKKIGPNFLRSTNLLFKILVRVNQPFIPIIHHIWGETLVWGTVFILQTSDRKQYFTIQIALNIHYDGSTRGLLAKPLKNFQNHLYGHPVLTFIVRAVASVWMNINRVTLLFIFYLMVY